MLEDLKQRLNLKENYVSMGLGLIVVLVVGAIIFNAATGRGKVGEVSKPAENVKEPESTPSANANNLPAKYKVGEGEDLWSISEKFYGSGFNWVDIVKANKIKNPDRVEVGTRLTIPAVTPKPTISKGKAQVYTVKKGETLFDVSVKMYGDGYKWVKIARANNLRNPNLIEAGQKLTIPR